MKKEKRKKEKEKEKKKTRGTVSVSHDPKNNGRSMPCYLATPRKVIVKLSPPS